jgi:hypothetical protein
LTDHAAVLNNTVFTLIFQLQGSKSKFYSLAVTNVVPEVANSVAHRMFLPFPKMKDSLRGGTKYQLRNVLGIAIYQCGKHKIQVKFLEL